MPATFFLVRAVVAPHLREKFDHWYSTDHLPWAIRVFKCIPIAVRLSEGVI